MLALVNAKPMAGLGALPPLRSSHVRQDQKDRLVRRSRAGPLGQFLYSEATVYWLPFSDSTLSDPISGRNGGILERNAMLACARSATSRYRKQAQSLRIVTDTSGADIAMPDEVRVYAVSRVSHAPFRP